MASVETFALEIPLTPKFQHLRATETVTATVATAATVAAQRKTLCFKHLRRHEGHVATLSHVGHFMADSFGLRPWRRAQPIFSVTHCQKDI
jgi:hypothetical protein